MRSCVESNDRNGGKFNIFSKYLISTQYFFSKPLTFVNEKSQKKEAVAVFKLVQIYMSDRKAKVRNLFSCFSSFRSSINAQGVSISVSDSYFKITRQSSCSLSLQDPYIYVLKTYSLSIQDSPLICVLRVNKHCESSCELLR